MKPTPAELEILGVLWRLEKATVREVHHELQKTKPTGYTTALKLMQIMADKGLVKRDERERTHVYRAAVKKEQAQKRLVGEMIDRLFGGSAAELVMQALSQRRASHREIAEIRRLLDEHERSRR